MNFMATMLTHYIIPPRINIPMKPYQPTLDMSSVLYIMECEISLDLV
uniref:Uncharacterized protein n=2 Tax=Picea TaxID=3328 RepID=A0A101LXB1_PICGL|nr:hypothetical protein ABT39_MTgene6087 [Picea glauca]QHR89954.1 hypothetical protein Q903MT_gene3976 [Picea sitchensis]